MKHSLPARFSRLKPGVFLVGFLFYLLPLLSWGQLLISSSSVVTQDFNGLGSTATASLPTGFKFAAGASPSYTGATTSATTAAAGTSGTGALNGTSGGGNYNFANGVTASSTDRAIGFLSTGTITSPRVIMLEIKNTSGSNISDLTIAFDYEKYRTGTRAFDMSFYTSTDGTNWTAVAAGNQSYVADGANAVVNPPTTISKSVSLTGINIADNSFLYLRWSYVGNGGSTNAQGLAIDNLTITPTIATSSSNPTVTNLSHSGVTKTSATIQAEITADGGTAVIERGFYYDVTAAPVANLTTSGSGLGVFNASISSLSSNTKYYYKAYATNGSGTTTTADGNFTTIPDEPVQTTATAAQNGFTTNWSAVSGPEAVTYRLDVSTVSNFASYVTGFQDKNIGSVTSYAVTGLASGTTYYYQLRTVNAGGTSINSATYSITTLTCPEPTNAASLLSTPVIKDDKINLTWTNGNGTNRIVIAKAGSAITASDLPTDGITYASSSNFGTSTQIGGSYVVYNGTGSSVTVNNLNGNTTYYFAVLEYGCTPEDYLISAYASTNATTEASALIRYSFTGAAGNEATLAADAQPGNATASAMSRGTGITGSSNGSTFSATGFSTGVIDLTDYYSFSVTPSVNYKVTLTKLELDERRSLTGIRTWVVRSSADNFTADLAIFNVPDDDLTRTDNIIDLTAAGAAFTDFTSAIEFRVYGYSAEAAGGTWRIDNVQAFGTVSALPPPSNTTVQFLTSSLKVNEATNTATVDLVISGESATAPTSIDVVLTSGSAADINNYSTQTITFPAASAANQTVTFTLTNDVLNEGTETLGFELQNISGGNTPVIGTQNNFSLKIIDNEIPDVFINEFHYNDDGSDEGEFVEVVLPASFTDLESITLSLYNGANGLVNGTHSLNTFSTNNITYGNYKVYYKAISGLENGPDGFSLDYDNQLIQLLSYGGAFAATSGPANGTTATDVGLSETDSDPAGSSLFLTQGGSPWIWAKQTGGNTMGLPNTNQPLPVELLSFSATSEGNTVKLNWATATEKNADRFEVERSANGIEFVKITSVKAAGNSSTAIRYNATDATPLSGISYYRLKQVDFDGTAQYSKILTVKQEARNREINLYPNPATNVITVQLPANVQTEIQVVNLLGQVVLKQNIRNSTETSLNIEALPVGTYQLLVNGQDFQSTKRFVKLIN